MKFIKNILTSKIIVIFGVNTKYNKLKKVSSAYYVLLLFINILREKIQISSFLIK